jgi:hypothetical protein
MENDIAKVDLILQNVDSWNCWNFCSLHFPLLDPVLDISRPMFYIQFQHVSTSCSMKSFSFLWQWTVPGAQSRPVVRVTSPLGGVQDLEKPSSYSWSALLSKPFWKKYPLISLCFARNWFD